MNIAFSQYPNIIVSSILVSISIWFVSHSDVHAGLLVNRTLYLGLTNGLTGHWTFDGPHMGGAGTTATDISGQGNHGTLTNGPVRRAGKIGQALEFDGTNDYVDTAKAMSTFISASNGTISVWFNPDRAGVDGDPGLAEDLPSVVSDNGGFMAITRGILISDGADRIRFMHWNGGFGGTRDVITTTYTPNEWVHLVWQYTNGTFSAFKNGAPIGSVASGDTEDLTGSFQIGRSFSGINGFQYTRGFIDDVRTYNRTLSQDEIKRLYRIGATLKVNTTISNDSLKNGLVGHWTFDGPHMGGAGTTATDISGQGNHGTLTNGPARAVGRIGQALSFDGANDNVNAGSGSTLDMVSSADPTKSKPITISAWINPRTIGGVSRGRIVDKSETFTSNGWKLMLNGVDVANGIDFLVNGATGVRRISVANAITLNIWQHVLATWDGSVDSTKVHIYVNGVEVSYSTTNSAVAPLDSDEIYSLFIGRGLTGDDGFDGFIDDVRVYTRVFTTDEIKRLYRIGATFKINTTISNDSLKNGLVGHWTFDGPHMGGAGTTATDISGQDNHGTLTNGPVRVAGKIGQALDFDGVDDRVDAGSAASVDNLPAISVSAWIYPRSFGSLVISPRIVDKTGALTDSGWRFNLLNGGLNLRTLMFNVDFDTFDLARRAANDSIVLNRWQRVVVSWGGGTAASDARIYVDGKEVAYGTSVDGSSIRTDDDGSTLYIGNEENVNQDFNGFIDDVRIYNRALSSDEIKRLYNLGR